MLDNPIPSAKEEKVILESTVDGRTSVKITNLRAVFGATVYSISNITSVSMLEKSPTVLIPLGLLAFGGLCLLSSFAGFATSHEINWITVLIGAVIVGLGILIIKTSKPSYVVHIGSASGQMAALQSTDKATIQNVVSAMNDAIVAKG